MPPRPQSRLLSRRLRIQEDLQKTRPAHKEVVEMDGVKSSRKNQVLFLLTYCDTVRISKQSLLISSHISTLWILKSFISGIRRLLIWPVSALYLTKTNYTLHDKNHQTLQLFHLNKTQTSSEPRIQLLQTNVSKYIVWMSFYIICNK